MTRVRGDRSAEYRARRANGRTPEELRAHRDAERRRYWARRYGMAPPVEIVRAQARPAIPLPPIPDVPDGHPLYDEARAALKGYERDELGSAIDYSARDLLQEFVLAVLEGRDPREAVRLVRRAGYQRRRLFVFGLDLTTDLVR